MDNKIEEYEKEIYDLKQLLEITKLLSSTLDYNKLKDSILFSFMAQARCVKAAVYTADIINPDIIIISRNYMGFEMSPVLPVQINCDTPIMQQLAKINSCITIDEFLPMMEGTNQELQDYIKDEIELVIPISSKDKITSLVFLGGRIDSEPITQNEKDFLSQIGLYSSIALQNSILFDKATIDLMTDLKVKHYLIKSVDDSIKSGEHRFVILMMDIDDFKKVNDTYGHQAGDDTLVAVSKVIKGNVRNDDIAARYGGEEFVILLRDTDLDEALIVAERIRSGVEELTINTKEADINVTISIGLAEFDDDIDKSTEDVIGRADNSLYISKNNGKNQITTS